MITSVQKVNGGLLIKGVSHDNGEVAAVTVNGRPADLISSHAGVADWEVSLETRGASITKLNAKAADRAGNQERTGHSVEAQR
jgi:hypothetical protein